MRVIAIVTEKENKILSLRGHEIKCIFLSIISECI